MKIHPLTLKGKMSVDELVREYDKSVFGAGRVAEAADIFERMVKEKATIFLGLSGAMVPAGMKGILVRLIREGMVSAIVSTGANVTHDLLEAFGGSHHKGISGTDAELRERGVDRIYDAFVEDRSFALLERRLAPLLVDIQKGRTRLTASELLFEVGRRVRAKESLVKQAFLNEVPIFVPALSDSVLGLQTFLFAQDHDFLVDEIGDIGKIVDMASHSKKTGAIILGGGVPKNFILQTMLMLPRSHDYVIQISTATPEDGGLSGASLSEAVSWGKVSEKSRLCTIYADATIVFPLLVAATLQRLGRH